MNDDGLDGLRKSLAWAQNKLEVIKMENAISIAQQQESGVGAIAGSAILSVMLNRASERPRDEQESLRASMAELEAVPGLAEDAYYSIPYESDGKKVPVEGLTIGAAMSLVRRWGNLLTGAKTVGEDDKGWDLEGTAYDLESNILIMRPYRVSKFYKPRGGQNVVPLDHNRRLAAFQSGVSKAVRNCALAVIPEWFKAAYFEMAKQLVLNPPQKIGKVAKSIQERILMARGAFAKNWKVTDAEMTDYLSGLALEDDNAVLLHLQGLFNGLKEGRESADNVFGRIKPQPTMPQEK